MLDHVQTVWLRSSKRALWVALRNDVRPVLCSDWRYRRQSSKWESKTMSTLRSLILVTLSIFVFNFLFELVWTVPGHAQQLPDQCLDNLPTPTLIAPSHRAVQLVNCSNST